MSQFVIDLIGIIFFVGAAMSIFISVVLIGSEGPVKCLENFFEARSRWRERRLELKEREEALAVRQAARKEEEVERLLALLAENPPTATVATKGVVPFDPAAVRPHRLAQR